jgi:cytochrome c556
MDMRSQPSRFIARALCGVAAVVCLLMASTAFAQQVAVPPTIKDPKEATRQQQDREATLRSAEVDAAREKAKERRIEINIAQIKQDYKRIQILRNEVAHMALANSPFDYRAIAERADAISKSAERLKTNLLPKMEEAKTDAPKSPVEFDQAGMRGALVRLCKLIDRFVENPSLKNPDLADAKQTVQAAQDLLTIMELSSNVKRSAEKRKSSR